MNKFPDRLLFIKGLMEILEGSFNEGEYSKIIIPFIIMKKLESLLKFSKRDIIEKYTEYKYMDDLNVLNHFAIDEKGEPLGFYNFSSYELNTLIKSPNDLEKNLCDYIDSFSSNIKEILDILDIKEILNSLSNSNILIHFLNELSNVKMDLHFELMTPKEFELIIEELILNFSKDPLMMGKYFIPSDVIELSVRLLFHIDEFNIHDKNLIKTIFDPIVSSGKSIDACYDFVLDENRSADIVSYGQEANKILYSLSKINLLLRKNDSKNIKGFKNFLSEDLFKDQQFDFIISNFSSIIDRSEQILLLQKIISKMKNNEKSRFVIITDEDPLIKGNKGSIENKIRQSIIDNDYLETIISLPENIFYDTIKPYVWILTNEKLEHRKKKVQFIKGSNEFVEMKDNVLKKTHGISKSKTKKILELYGSKTNSNLVSFINNSDINHDNLSFEDLTFEIKSSSDKLNKDISVKTEVKTKIKSSKNNKISKNSTEFNQKEFEKWIETLPFPLASILYAYDIESNYDRKIKYLLHFFEAISEFNFNLIISAVSSDLKFYNSYFSKCRASYNKKFSRWFFKPTFGNWNNFGSCFAKSIRTILENNNNKPKLLELFGNPNESFVKMVSSRKFYNLLFKIAEFRNRWEGHGPIVDKKEQLKRLKILKKALTILQSIISDNYKNFNLIAPIKSRYSEGIYYSSVKRLMTTRPPFKSIDIKTNIPLDINKKYLVYKDNSIAIELLPLFDIIESPQKEQEACYFYNVTEKDKVQYVSYHFNKEAIINFEKNKLEKVFNIIK
ncbi:MAG: N-6 DNA methylase [Methanobrevibacter arboriphilus]|uniref:site-specific DNA-methyltransferase (adenine-specific) n=1 Tax=Methanobrevibacter arboriphilus TaxID=39441 RepID=A0A843ALP0_METAZ|nr:N-6 DNA methylase [Methanobrevibacter arboriphilus]MBF4468249.1 N-6 DNA methylase [Methanobrevibacter arboriphilus]